MQSPVLCIVALAVAACARGSAAISVLVAASATMQDGWLQSRTNLRTARSLLTFCILLMFVCILWGFFVCANLFRHQHTFMHCFLSAEQEKVWNLVEWLIGFRKSLCPCRVVKIAHVLIGYMCFMMLEAYHLCTGLWFVMLQPTAVRSKITEHTFFVMAEI